MKQILLIISLLLSLIGHSQVQQDSLQYNSGNLINTAQRMLNFNINKGFSLGGYGEITYNQPEASNGELDVQRLVLLFGYKFDDRTQFITEVEYEHVQEVSVEQAFLNYRLNNYINLRAGLMLVPMGIVNEYHEPTTFNGVERPSIDAAIVPTTWREIGVGISGRFDDASLRYQAYIFNGFKSAEADGEGGVKGFLGGSKGLRGGRQKGIQSTINSPTFAAKIDHYGIPGLRLGLSGYVGRTQAEGAINHIDGADVGIAMIGVDARYTNKRFYARSQFINARISDTEAYNNLTGKDLGSGLQGWYLEMSYNLLNQEKKQRLLTFVRYENYDLHHDVSGNLVKNLSYDKNEWTMGLSYHIARGAVVKADYQIKNNAVPNAKSSNQLNIGVGVWFY